MATVRMIFVNDDSGEVLESYQVNSLEYDTPLNLARAIADSAGFDFEVVDENDM